MVLRGALRSSRRNRRASIRLAKKQTRATQRLRTEKRKDKLFRTQQTSKSLRKKRRQTKLKPFKNVAREVGKAGQRATKTLPRSLPKQSRPPKAPTLKGQPQTMESVVFGGVARTDFERRKSGSSKNDIFS